MKVVILGAGQVGYSTARYLAASKLDVTVVDHVPELVRELSDNYDIRGVVGHASDPQVLTDARLDEADLMIAVTNSDELNMFSCKVAHTLFQVPTKIARVRRQSYLSPQWSVLFDQDNLGVDVVISPEQELAESIWRSIELNGANQVIPMVDDFVKIIALQVDEQSSLNQTAVNHLSKLFQNFDMRVLAIIRNQEVLLSTDKETIQAGDELFCLVQTGFEEHLMEGFGFSQDRGRHFLLLGGGSVGLHIAKRLENLTPEPIVRVIEYDGARTEVLARELRRTIILRGNAIDPELLLESNIARTETLVALTNDDKVNALGALLAKRQGARRTLAIINNPIYTSLVSSLGVDVVINPRSITVSKILQHVRKGRIRAVYTMRDNLGEILELKVTESSGLEGATIYEIEQPGKRVVGCIIRNSEILWPRRETTLKVGDTIILSAVAEEIENVEKIFSGQTRIM